jgi:hypothetical protein
VAKDLAPLLQALQREPELQPDTLYPGDEAVPPRPSRLAA